MTTNIPAVPSHLFGWIPPAERTPQQTVIATAQVAAMPKFQISGPWKSAGDKAALWSFTKALRNGKHLPALYQSIGSCVGHGKCKAEWYLIHVQIALLHKNEEPHIPYEPYGYAQSRVCAGISGNEDGSTGSGAAEAARKYGVLRADFTGLPAPMVEDGTETLKTPGSIDKSWGMNGCPSASDIGEGQHHLVKTTAPVRNSTDVATALQNGYPITIASDWGGLMQCPTEGNPAVLLNHHADTWPHQMSVNAWEKHPTLGEIFHIDNSWGADAHGANPDDAPPGGFWVRAADINYIVGQNDSFAYSLFDGFPAATPEAIAWIFQ